MNTLVLADQQKIILTGSVRTPDVIDKIMRTLDAIDICLPRAMTDRDG